MRKGRRTISCVVQCINNSRPTFTTAVQCAKPLLAELIVIGIVIIVVIVVVIVASQRASKKKKGERKLRRGTLFNAPSKLGEIRAKPFFSRQLPFTE